MSSVWLVYLQLCTIYMIWLLSAFKPNVSIGIQARLLLMHTGSSTGTSTQTHPRFVLKYWCTWVLDWLPLVSATIGFTQVGSLRGSQPKECVVTWNPAALRYPVKTSIVILKFSYQWSWRIHTCYTLLLYSVGKLWSTDGESCFYFTWGYLRSEN